MFTKSDLFALMNATPDMGVSIFMPTHVRGAEIRQGPIRLKNLLSEARDRLAARGMRGAEIDALLKPATARMDDYSFWQHQNEGLALFLGAEAPYEYRVPLSFDERVVIGSGFHVKPLLPLLAADGAFHVLTITAERVRLYDASRFGMHRVDLDDAPDDLAEVMGRADYENPLQGPPATRPRAGGPAAGGQTISKSEVMGDSPEDWRKDRLVEYIRRVASAVEDRLASDAVPVVLVADAETGGHFRKHSALGPLLAEVVERNPGSMDDDALHAAAYEAMRPHFEAGRQEAVDRFASLHGSGDARAAVGLDGVSDAAAEGRIDTLLMAEDVFSHQPGTETGADGGDAMRDRLDEAAVGTLQQGGTLYIVPNADLPENASVAAILRY
ncbi:hypothetical protein OCGS_2741 [Oceaniovalibus guishaninsula JLT2003]|uniref:Uncharacterized protein n=1 Tax=Oceaniovalibus guishaninsula JLT2003 TaxID=1231392 RepID=K2I2T4_9RHOB|nr:hypothetical protein [Oceaniovalibus guishaninsula]EKE43150.1 hypothetical protein OCGS_2741 [Oceaniovalibus guishaninsula JLT2003]